MNEKSNKSSLHENTIDKNEVNIVQKSVSLADNSLPEYKFNYQSYVDLRPHLLKNPTTFSVRDFCCLYGIGKTTAWKLIREGKIDVCRPNRRTLIFVESASAFIESCRVRRQS